MLSDKRFLFIIGSPRSGTTWLQTMLAAHPQVCTTVELTLFSNYTGPWIKRWRKEKANIDDGRWNQGLPFLWSEEEFYGFLQDFLAKVYEKVVSTNPQATHILDKHPGYSAYVEDINELLPGAKFIHLIRDGRDVAASMIAAREHIGFGPETVVDAARQWKKNVLEARKAASFADRYLEVRYEDLLVQGERVLTSVFDFCDLPVVQEDVYHIVNTHQFDDMKAKRMAADERVEASRGHYRKGKSGSWREDLNAQQQYVFYRIAGDLLHELGYAEKNWWIEHGYDKFLLPFSYAWYIAGSRASRGIKLLLSKGGGA